MGAYANYQQQYANYYNAALMGQMTAAAMAGRYSGTIRFFNEAKGFGFIECPEANARYGRDVFLHKADFAGFAVGQDVTFRVEPNKDGMPQARDLSVSKGKGKGKGKDGKGKEGKGKEGGKGKD